MKIIQINKKANFNYTVIDKYEAGVMLNGQEAKVVREYGIQLNNAYAIILKDECFLLNANINIPKKNNTFTESDPLRTRKLLLHKKQIMKIKLKIKKEKLTLIPLKAYYIKSNVKILIGLCKGKNKYDKRQDLIKKEITKKLNKKNKII